VDNRYICVTRGKDMSGLRYCMNLHDITQDTYKFMNEREIANSKYLFGMEIIHQHQLKRILNEGQLSELLL
jgi:hypothetical protein